MDTKDYAGKGKMEALAAAKELKTSAPESGELLAYGTVKGSYSDNDSCVCCKGAHRFTTKLINSDQQAMDLHDIVWNGIKKLPDGAVVRIDLKILSE